MSTLGPRSTERPADAGYTLIGCLDSTDAPRIDGGGLIQPGGCGWSVDWWIGADDRWHFPSKESSVRQSRLGSGPVVETMVRIPGGNAVHRSYGVSTPDGELTVIDIENSSPTAVRLGLAIRPYGIDGADSTPSIRISDRLIKVDGRDRIGLPRAASLVMASNEDVHGLVGEASVPFGEGRSEGSGSNSVVVYPLPHRASIRFVIGSFDYRGGLSVGVPDSQAVARGWDSVISAGGTLTLPDSGLAARAGAARSRLVGASGSLPNRVAELASGSGRHLHALALSGARHDVEFSMAAFANRFPRKLSVAPIDAAAVVAAVGRGAGLIDDQDLLNPVVETATQVTTLVENSGDRTATGLALGGLARLASALGQLDVARDLLAKSGQSPYPGVPSDLDSLGALAKASSGAGSWGNDEVDPAARYWIGLRGLVLDERHGSDLVELVLLPGFPAAWRGGNMEVLGLPSDVGPVGFAVRWHGTRPALLWDVKTDGPVRITCPGLDPDWSTLEPKGEALLSGGVEAS